MPSSRNSKKGSLQSVRTVPIDQIEPYWRNPRRIPNEAVNAVAESITRYGYLQPIVVDEKNVIIIGHTRYAALRRLGYTEVEVAVESGLNSNEVKQLRAVDNRVSEFSTWDFEKLIEEIDSLSPEALRSYFPEIVGDEYEESAKNSVEITVEVEPYQESEVTEFICPACFHGWEQAVSKEQILSGTIEGAE